MQERLTQREDWQQRMLQTAFDEVTKEYTNRYGDADNDGHSDLSMTPRAMEDTEQDNAQQSMQLHA
jgi:hypothetical protein